MCWKCGWTFLTLKNGEERGKSCPGVATLSSNCFSLCVIKLEREAILYGLLQDPLQNLHDLKGNSRDNRGTRNGQDPRHHDPSRQAPSDSAHPCGGTDSHDGSGNCMRGADSDSTKRRDQQRDRTGGLSTKASRGLESGDFLAHRLHDPPPPKQRAERDRNVAADDDPPRNLKRLKVSSR